MSHNYVQIKGQELPTRVLGKHGLILFEPTGIKFRNETGNWQYVIYSDVEMISIAEQTQG